MAWKRRNLARLIAVGSGVVGASCAYTASRLGAEVVLADAALPGGATAAGAGIICPWSSRVDDPVWYGFACPSAREYPRPIAELAELGEAEVGDRQAGRPAARPLPRQCGGRPGCGRPGGHSAARLPLRPRRRRAARRAARRGRRRFQGCRGRYPRDRLRLRLPGHAGRPRRGSRARAGRGARPCRRQLPGNQGGISPARPGHPAAARAGWRRRAAGGRHRPRRLRPDHGPYAGAIAARAALGVPQAIDLAPFEPLRSPPAPAH